MADLEKKLCELLHELPQKRDDFEELQQRYNAELLSKRELRAEIEHLKTEAKNARTQLELTTKALHKCEENYSNSRESAVKHRLNLEAVTKAVDAMKDQATKQHMENAKLKKQVEDLERDMKAESFFRETCSSIKAKTQTTIDSLTTQIRNLEKDCRDMERHTKEAISIGSKSKLLLEHKDATIDRLKTTTEELSSQIISLTSENRRLQENMQERKPVEQHYVKEILQEWQTSVNEMKVKNSNFEKEAETLNQALQNALKAQSKFQKLEAASNGRVRELEEKLQIAKNADKKKRTDCSVQTDLNISIDVACETAPLAAAHVSTQTDSHQQEDKEDDIVTSQDRRPTEIKQNSSKYSYSSGVLTSNTMHSSALSALISKYKQEKELSTQTLSEMATQVNNNVST